MVNQAHLSRAEKQTLFARQPEESSDDWVTRATILCYEMYGGCLLSTKTMYRQLLVLGCILFFLALELADTLIPGQPGIIDCLVVGFLFAPLGTAWFCMLKGENVWLVQEVKQIYYRMTVNAFKRQEHLTSDDVFEGIQHLLPLMCYVMTKSFSRSESVLDEIVFYEKQVSFSMAESMDWYEKKKHDSGLTVSDYRFIDGILRLCCDKGLNAKRIAAAKSIQAVAEK